MALQQKKALSKTSKVRPSTGNSASAPQSQVIGDRSVIIYIYFLRARETERIYKTAD